MLETIWPALPQNSPTLLVRIPDKRATGTGLGCSELIRFQQVSSYFHQSVDADLVP